MPDDPRKTETDELLARVDEVMEQAQLLRTDLSRRMHQQRAHDRPVTQPLSPRKASKRQRK